MQINNKNKMVDGTKEKNKGVGSEEFFFSGGLEYLPQTILAEGREEAEKIWQETRKSRVADINN
jgi:hypothetical protein